MERRQLLNSALPRWGSISGGWPKRGDGGVSGVCFGKGDD